jgi:hypothetical protein
MVVGHIGTKCYFYGTAGAFALQLATFLVGVALLDTVIDERV